MKKLLSLLGGIAIASTSASAVVACSDNSYTLDHNGQGQGMQTSHQNDESEIQASLFARAKTLVLDDQFGLSDNITKKYMQDLKVSRFVKTNDTTLNGETMKDIYSNFMDDSSIDTANTSNGGASFTGNIGDDGGIVEKTEQSLLDLITNKISPDVTSALHGILAGILNAEGLNSKLLGTPKLGQVISDALSPILQAIGQLNTPTAMSGIPYALTLLPTTIQGNKAYGLIQKALSALLDSLQSKQTDFDNLFAPFLASADLSNLGNKTLGDVQKIIGDILTELISQKDVNAKPLSTQDMLDDVIRLISLGGYYLAAFDTDANTFDSVASTGWKLSDSVFYKSNEGKGFNLAAILKAISYFVGDSKTPDKNKIKKLLQAIFIDVTDKTKLSSLGQFVCGEISSSLKIDNTMLSALLLSALTGSNDAIFDAIFNSWDNLAVIDANTFGKLVKTIDSSIMLKRVFHNDDTGVTAPTASYSLSGLMQVPLYKLLMLAGQQDFSSNATDVKTGTSEMDKTNLLPNYAGEFTKSSIVELANEASSVFKIGDDDTNESLQYRYFLFGDTSKVGQKPQIDDKSTLGKFLDELLFSDPYNNDGKQGVLSELLQWIGQPGAWKIADQKLGYVVATTGTPPNDVINGVDTKTVYTKSIMGDILRMLVPKLSEITGDTISLNDVMSDSDSDNMTFFASSLSSFIGDLMKPTDYDYWLNIMMKNPYLFDIDGSNAQPWQKKFGYQTSYFDKDNKYVKDMTLTVNFDFRRLDTGLNLKPGEHASMLNLIPLVYPDHGETYTIKISRDNYYSSYFKFVSIEKEPLK